MSSARAQAFRALIQPPDTHPLATFADTDAGNGERFAFDQQGRVTYVNGIGWHVYDGRRHQLLADNLQPTDQAVETMRATGVAAASLPDTRRLELQRWVLQSESLQRLKAMIALGTGRLSAPPSDFNRRTDLFNCLNGTVDLRTGELRQHDPEDMLTQLSAIVYDPEAECPQWEALLRYAFWADVEDEARRAEGEEMVRYVQRLFGYCLTGDVSEKMLALFHGRSNAGKTTITDTLRDIVGPDYYVKVEQTTLDAASPKKSGGSASPEVVKLIDKRFARLSETESGMKLKDDKVKEWTGLSDLTGRALYKNDVSFQTRFKLIIETNNKPNMVGSDQAMWNRVHLVPFEREIERKEKGFGERLVAEEGPGILAWIVRGSGEWYRQGLNPPVTVLKATADYKEKSDSLANFLFDMCELGPSETITTKHLRQLYVSWCDDNGDQERLGTHEFNEVMERHPGLRREGQGGRRWRGVGIKPLADIVQAERESEGPAYARMLGTS